MRPFFVPNFWVEKGSVSETPNPEPKNTMKTHPRHPASTALTSPVRLKIQTLILAKTILVFTVGLLIILSTATSVRMVADSPSITVTDANTQVTGDLNITGNLLKNGVPWTLGSASIVEAGNSMDAETLSLQNSGILYVVPKTGTVDGSVWFAGKLIVGERSQPATVLLTPSMTSNTTPAPFVVTTSSVYQSSDGFLGFNAFDQRQYHSGTSGSGWFSGQYSFDTSGNGGERITIYLGPTARNLRRVVVRSGGNSNGYDAPLDCTLQGSADGATFTDIAAFTNLPLPNPAAYGVVLDVPATALINYFRLLVTRVPTANNSNRFVHIGEIELYGY